MLVKPDPSSLCQQTFAYAVAELFISVPQFIKAYVKANSKK